MVDPGTVAAILPLLLTLLTEISRAMDNMKFLKSEAGFNKRIKWFYTAIEEMDKGILPEGPLEALVDVMEQTRDVCRQCGKGRISRWLHHGSLTASLTELQVKIDRCRDDFEWLKAHAPVERIYAREVETMVVDVEELETVAVQANIKAYDDFSELLQQTSSRRAPDSNEEMVEAVSELVEGGIFTFNEVIEFMREIVELNETRLQSQEMHFLEQIAASLGRTFEVAGGGLHANAGYGGNHSDRRPPNEFLCPISGDLMQDPVVTLVGQTYERASIENWLRRHQTDPLTNEELPNKLLVPNFALRKLIREWQQTGWPNAEGIGQPSTSGRAADEARRHASPNGGSSASCAATQTPESEGHELGLSPHFQDLAEKAQQGDSQAQFELGVRYENGTGVPRDSVIAVTYYSEAAEQGHPGACYHLGECLRLGRGVPETNDEEAARYFGIAANEGNARAQSALGWLLQHGNGVPKDENGAVQMYTMAASQELAEAQFRLGWCLQHSVGVKQNLQEAVEWYTRAATQGYPQAQHILAWCYEHGNGVRRDGEVSHSWYRRACGAGL